jgi:hypothetical protein
VLATHGRGLWILDNLTSLQQLTPDVTAKDAHLFPIEPAKMIRYANTKAHAGDMVFRGANPPAGAVIDYYLKSGGTAIRLSVHDAAGRQIASLEPGRRRGVNRVVWPLRYPDLGRSTSRADDDEGGSGGRIEGPFVLPGTYTVRLSASGVAQEQTVEVADDPRIDVPRETRRQWTDTVLQLADLYRSTTTMAETSQGLERKSAAADPKTDPQVAERRELARLTRELQSRVLRLYQAIDASVSAPTVDQKGRLDYLSTFANVLEARVRLAAGR